jgi:predicted DNA-binding protein (MmcQ/YjbR family)
MNIEAVRSYCLNLKGTTEGFPFDQKTLVFKVMGKMFALLDVDNFVSINLKCDPEKAVSLREMYVGVTPGFHMNKSLWNTVRINEDVSDKLIYELIVHSYQQVVLKLKKKLQNELQG